MTKYVLAPAYAGAQYWNADKSDLIEVRKQPGSAHTEIPGDIPDDQAKRLLDLGAIIPASKAETAEAPPAGALEEPAGNAARDDWAAYADSLGLVVEAGSGREDIKQQITDSRK